MKSSLEKKEKKKNPHTHKKKERKQATEIVKL